MTREELIDRPALYVVATPIGNLDDLTPRARAVLGAVDVIAAEDTRVTRKLLSHFDIHGPRLVSYHDHGEETRAEALVTDIVTRRHALALVTDAGTPAVSDPGYRLAAAAHAAGIPVRPVAGPSALTALVSASGLASDRVLFVGFLPEKVKDRRAEIESWRTARAAVVFYEPTRKLADCLKLIQELHPAAKVAVGRELTKLHEEVVTKSIDDAVAWALAHETLKGEASIMVELPRDSGAPAALTREEITAAAVAAFAQGVTLKDLLQRFRDAGLPRTELYDLLLAAKDG